MLQQPQIRLMVNCYYLMYANARFQSVGITSDFSDQICPKKYESKEFKKINIKIVVSIQPCTLVLQRISDFETKFAQKHMTDKNFEKINLKIVTSIQECTPLQNFSQFQESQILEQICPENMNEKNFEKLNIKIVISIQQCTPIASFSQFGELQFLGPNMPKNTLGQTQPENHLFQIKKI